MHVALRTLLALRIPTMASVKVLEKRMRAGFSSGEYYVGEQACRTLYHRLARPARAGKSPPVEDLTRAFDIVASGASELLSKTQFQAGSALSLLALKHLSDHEVGVQEEGTLTRVRTLCHSYDVPRESDGAVEAWKEQLRVVKAALKWTSSRNCGGSQHGDPALNALAGAVSVDLLDFHAAQRFYLRSDEPTAMAVMLHKWATVEGLASESDLFITRAILAYLVSENLGDGNVVLAECRHLFKWPASGATDPSAVPPLVNFCELLLKACQLGHPAAALFTRIRSVYKAPLSADPQLETMMETIALKYFNIQAPQPAGMAGMMQSMLRGMTAPNG